MILKEAFRYQNYLLKLVTSCTQYVYKNENLFKTEQTHLKSKANSDAKDEILVVERTTDIAPNEIISLLELLVSEKVAITNAIAQAKSKVEFDIDANLNINKFRDNIIHILDVFNNAKSSEKELTGTDYKFNINGDQSPYKYTVKEVKTIDFDRNKTRSLYKTFKKENDDTSNYIDKLDVTVYVDFEPKFNIDDSLEDVIESLR